MVVIALVVQDIDGISYHIGDYWFCPSGEATALKPRLFQSCQTHDFCLGFQSVNKRSFSFSHERNMQRLPGTLVGDSKVLSESG